MKTKIFATTDPCDEKKLEKYLASLSAQKQKNIHFDVMDGNFVAAKKISQKTIIELSNKFSNLNFGVHLMVKNPTEYINKLAGAGKNVKTIFAHIEAFKNEKQIEEFVAACKSLGFKAGLAISPETKLEKEELTIARKIKNILILGVIPGKSGQKLISSSIKKVAKLKAADSKIKVAFDGGVNEKNIKKIADMGADEICLGSLMFKLNESGKVHEFLKNF